MFGGKFIRRKGRGPVGEKGNNACPGICPFTQGCIEDESAGIIEIPGARARIVVAFQKGYLDKGKNAFGSRPLCNVGQGEGVGDTRADKSAWSCAASTRVGTERAIF